MLWLIVCAATMLLTQAADEDNAGTTYPSYTDTYYTDYYSDYYSEVGTEPPPSPDINIGKCTSKSPCLALTIRAIRSS